MAPRKSPRYISNFYPPQEIEGRAARWSAAFAYIRLPGTGATALCGYNWISIRPGRALRIQSRQPLRLSWAASSFSAGPTLPVRAGQTITLDVDRQHPAALAARDLVIELRTDVFRPPDYQGNELGIAVSNVSVDPLPGAGWQPVVPNVRVMLLSLALVLGVYLFVARSYAGGRTERRVPRWLVVVPLAASLLLAAWLALDVLGLAAALLPLTLGIYVAYLLLLAAYYLLPLVAPTMLVEARAIYMALNYPALLGLVVAAPILFGIAFQAPTSYTIDVGSGHDTPFLQGFNPPMYPMPDGSPGDYRFTSQLAVISIPGAGANNTYSVTMRLNPGTGPASQGRVAIVANGSIWAICA